MKNSIGWYEIAVKDMDRAKAFYTKVMNAEFQDINVGESQLAMFSKDEKDQGIVGALVKDKDNIPSASGTIIYFQSEDVSIEASKIEASGGKLLFPKTSIGEFGFISQFIDTKGNRIGIHSNK